MDRPSGAKTHASGRGAISSELRGVSRVVTPVVTSVVQTLLSIACAIRRPSALHVKVEPTSQEFLVSCRNSPVAVETSQSWEMPVSSRMRPAIFDPSGEARSQWRFPWRPGYFRSAVKVSRR